MTVPSNRCVARVRRYTGKRFPASTRCEKPRREGMQTCWSHRAQEPVLDKCHTCPIDPNKEEYRGRQIYCCEKCRALVCSDCSEDADSKRFPGVINPVVCLPCYHELKELEAEQAGLR